MIRRATLVVGLVALLHVTARGASDQGKVLDRPALARVETFCVETQNLRDDEIIVLKGFLKEQSKPKGLFKDMRWKRIENCQNSAADATIMLELPWYHDPEPVPHPPPNRLKGILHVYDTSSSGIIYTAEALSFVSTVENPSREPAQSILGADLFQRRNDVLWRVFSMLIHDVKSLPPQPKN